MSCAIRKDSRGQPFKEAAGNRLTWREADGMHEAVEFRPDLAQLVEGAFDLLVAADIAIEDQSRVELCCEVGDALLEALAHVAEGQFGAFAVAGSGDAVGNGTVGQHAANEQAFAGQETHGVIPLKRGADSGTRSAWQGNPEPFRSRIRPSLKL